MTNNNNFMLIIYGPTGVGKTDFAEQIAQKIPAEIVNIDLGQLYTPLSIGTAKPLWQESPIKHHLFDILHDPHNYCVTQYRTTLLATLHDIWQRGKMPILVGGSSFYIKSLFFPPTAPTAGDSMHIEFDMHDTWERLNTIDHVRAAHIDKNDQYRISRALAIWRKTGKKPSEYTTSYAPPSDFVLLFLTREREELYERINQRVESMMQQGWLDEVRALYHTPWEPFLREKKLIGYNELLDFIANEDNEQSLDVVVDIIAQRTRNYAKRQHTFWRSLKKQLEQAIKQASFPSELEEVNLTSINSDLYIKHLLKKVVDKVK